MFYNEYLRLCKMNGETPTGAAKAMGLSGAHVNKWKKGSTPTDITLYKIAEHFGLNADHFSTTEAEKEQKETHTAEISDVRQKAYKLIGALSDEQLMRFIKIAEIVKEEDR